MILKKMEVLVVSCDLDSMWYSDSKLTCHRFAVRLARDWNSTLSSVAVEPPDVIVLDFNAPDIDGPALARSCRQLNRMKKAPLLLIGVECYDESAAAREPIAMGVDLLLSRDGPGVGGVLIGVLNRFRDFLFDLKREKPSAEWLEAPFQFTSHRSA